MRGLTRPSVRGIRDDASKRRHQGKRYEPTPWGSVITGVSSHRASSAARYRRNTSNLGNGPGPPPVSTKETKLTPSSSRKLA